MSIEALKKITLYGLQSEKNELLQGLQQLGCMHLIPLVQPDEIQTEQTEPQAAREALSWLQNCGVKRREAQFTADLSATDIVALVQDNKVRHRAASDRCEALTKRIREVQPWGEFAFPPLDEMAGMRLWFYIIPLKDMALVEALELPYEIVHQDNKDAYVVLLSETEPSAELLPFRRSHIGYYSLSQLEQQLATAEIVLEDIQGERENLTRWIYVIGQAIARFDDLEALKEASASTLEEDQFFLIAGWMPVDRETDVRHFVEVRKVAIIIESPTPEDNPPTLLQSSKNTGGGSEAFGFFQTPGYRSWDPGKLVFYSFSLFFAMIMSDAAYCAIFAGIIFMFRKKFQQSQGGVRLMNMGYFMSGLGVIWGMLIGSYFGYAPSKGSLLGDLAFINLNDYDAMMALSIAIGVIHLVVANVMNYLSNRQSPTALAHVGWAVIMCGGLSLYLGKIDYLPQAFGSVIGPALLIGGAATVFIYSSARQVDSIKSLLLRILEGLQGLYNVTGAFGDILSYMRLFALGLSGASLALTFNNLAHEALASNPVAGVVFAAVILILGHTLNFALCIMSGVVHGMRLNVIEFVNWGMSDEGYPFKAFRKQED